MIIAKRGKQEAVESLIRRFNRKVKDEKIFIEVKEKSFYKSKSTKRKEALRRSKKRIFKEKPENFKPSLLEQSWQEM